MADPRAVLQDAGYVTVGFGLLAFQRAQVRRRELEKQLAEAGVQVDRLAASVDEARKLVEERAAAVGEQLDRTIEVVRGRIPEEAAEVLDTAVGVAKEAAGQLIELVRPTSEA